MLGFSQIAFHVKLFVKHVVLGQRNTLSLQHFFSTTRQLSKIENLAIFENSSYKNKWQSRNIASFTQK